MTAPRQPARYQGVFPVVPTIFDAGGGLDLAGQKRCVDFMAVLLGVCAVLIGSLMRG